MPSTALSHIRICDFSGQLAGAGATRFLAAFGAQVIRIEDPVKQGRWDILRSSGPFVDDRRGVDFGGGFQNHNVEKLGITLNLRTARGQELLREIVRRSDVVAENFAAGVMQRLGLGYDELCAIRPDIIYASNCGFGHTGPYSSYLTWGPVVQAVCGLTFSSGLPHSPPAGWGYSYMDHVGGHYMAMAILMALVHRNRSGAGQWIDMACTEAGATLNGPAMLDYTVNGRPLRREGMPNSNRSQFPRMAPHGIYPCREQDSWISISCRDDNDWRVCAADIGEEWAASDDYATLERRIAREDQLDTALGNWSSQHDNRSLAQRLCAVGVPAAAVQSPQQRIDDDANTAHWGLWPTVTHRLMGDIRVDGIPVHLSETDWQLRKGAPCLGEHNDKVYGELLGLAPQEIEQLRQEGII
jgi:benzylsuccinate CoA-transferase BbsF subunit